MLSLFIRNLIFTILQPGIVAGLIPVQILGERVKEPFIHPLQIQHYGASILFLAGLAILLTCIISFAVNGRGTLSPADPTKKLVITGLYHFSRNPMYVGITLILTGEAVFFQSISLWIYALLIFIAFYIFILLFEEPRLRKDFSEEYTRYCEKVRRWIWSLQKLLNRKFNFALIDHFLKKLFFCISCSPNRKVHYQIFHVHK